MLRVLISLLPLILFYALESWAGLGPAVIATMVAVVGDVAWTWRREGRISRITMISAPLVIGLGTITLVADDPYFTLVGPAVGDVVFATLLLGARLLGHNLLLVALEEVDPGAELHPLQANHLGGTSLRLAVNLLAHAVAVVLAAEASREVWLFVAGPQQMIQIGVQVAGELAWLHWVVGPKVDADDAAAAARNAAAPEGGP